MADPVAVMDDRIRSDDLDLAAHLAVPDRGGDAHGVVLCHGFPVRGRESPASGKSFPELADRIVGQIGWTALSFNYRGCGTSGGDFSLQGWHDDIGSAAGHLRSIGVGSVWLVGMGTGGALCITYAATHSDIAGVAALAAPADFNDWSRNPRRLVQHGREVGVITSPDFPDDTDRWAAELKTLGADRHVADLAPRPLLLLHGDADDLVPSLDTRALADAHGSADMRIIGGAGHELRHDPRAVAILLGWLSRQEQMAMG